MLHKNSRERFDKLQNVFRRLMRNFNLDDLDDFIATVNTMPTWMKHDVSLVQEQRDAIAGFTVPESVDWQICTQIANRQKHVLPQTRHGHPALQVNSVRATSGAPGVLLPPRTIGAGQEIFVDYGGTKESALALVIRTFRHFHYMFEMAVVPPAQRQIPSLSDLVG